MLFEGTGSAKDNEEVIVEVDGGALLGRDSASGSPFISKEEEVSTETSTTGRDTGHK